MSAEELAKRILGLEIREDYKGEVIALVNPNEAFSFTWSESDEAYEKVEDSISHSLDNRDDVNKFSYIDNQFFILGDVYKWFAMKGMNLKKEGKALQILFKNQPLTREEFFSSLVQDDLVSKNRNSQFGFLKNLLDKQIITTTGGKSKGRGRPPQMLKFNTESMKGYLRTSDEQGHIFMAEAFRILDIDKSDGYDTYIKIEDEVVVYWNESLFNE